MKWIATIVVLTAAMTAPALAQAAPRSASTQYRLHQERMHRSTRHHPADRYQYQPAYHCETGDAVGVIADDVTGENPFGAPSCWGNGKRL